MSHCNPVRFASLWNDILHSFGFVGNYPIVRNGAHCDTLLVPNEERPVSKLLQELPPNRKERRNPPVTSNLCT